MKMEFILNMSDSAQAPVWILHGHAPNDTMHLIPLEK
jgi:hypothetical protein